MKSNNELILVEDAENELSALKDEIDVKSENLDYDYEEINSKAQRIMEWLKCVLSLGWAHNKIPDELNEEAMAKRGAIDGSLKIPQPAANETQESDIEQQVITHYRNLESLKTRVEPIVIGVIECAKSSIDNLKVLKDNILRSDSEKGVKDTLEEYKESFREARKYFKDFRYAHNLRRDVRYEEDMGNFLSIIFIYLVIEAAVNGFFYSKVADGLIEGWGIALTVAILVIALGAGAGEWGTKLRGLSRCTPPLGISKDILHRQGWHTSDENEWYKWKKHGFLHILWWGIITLGCVILGIIVIVFAYIYRDAAEYLLNTGGFDNLERQMTEAIVIMAEAGKRFVDLDLFPASGLSAFSLIVVNGLGFILSFYKFHFTRDDCIPDYADAARDLKKAREAYKEVISKVDVSRDLSKFKETTEKNIEHRIREMETFIMKIRHGTGAMRDILPTLADEYTTACNNILESYREANRRERPSDDKAGPAYFKKFQTFASIDMDEFEKAYEELCAEIKNIDINGIIKDTRDWKSKLIKEHIKDAEKNEGIELTKKQRDKIKKER